MSSNEAPTYTLGPYIMQTLLLLLAPALYAASIYMILGRIIVLTEGDRLSIIPRKWLTKLFVFGDVLSFLLQGAGGGIMASGSLEALHNGERIIISGLVVQIIFFSLFAITACIFHVRLSHSPTEKVVAFDIPWRKYLHVLYIVSFLVIVRSMFRLIEYAQGNDGYLISHEIYLYIFDSLLMWLAMMAFAWEHPSEINAKLRQGSKAVRRFTKFYYAK
ncbi:hypothetical protein S40293_07904 [Stachybotrys chartarum IBT 40293]|nr:hypothetical protein S40293_07904 [Stachybotrys chartarum IBT 40293]